MNFIRRLRADSGSKWCHQHNKVAFTFWIIWLCFGNTSSIFLNVNDQDSPSPGQELATMERPAVVSFPVVYVFAKKLHWNTPKKCRQTVWTICPCIGGNEFTNLEGEVGRLPQSVRQLGRHCEQNNVCLYHLPCYQVLARFWEGVKGVFEGCLSLPDPTLIQHVDSAVKTLDEERQYIASRSVRRCARHQRHRAHTQLQCYLANPLFSMFA